MQSGHASHALHNKLLHNEVDILEFNEKYYLPRQRLFFEITEFLGLKVHYLAAISSHDLFFFRDHCIFRTKSALPGTDFK